MRGCWSSALVVWAVRPCCTWRRPESARWASSNSTPLTSRTLQRQIIHGQSDIGKSKAQSAKESIAETNPLVRVVVHDTRLDNDNVMDIFDQYDLIIDGTDNFATRYLVNDACVLLGKPYVWGSIYRFDGQVSVFWAEHGPVIAACIRNRRRLEWCPAALKAGCSAYCAHPSVQARSPRRSSC